MANKAMVWLEESFAPSMNKVSNNIWVRTIKDSLMQTLPLIFVGSLITILAILQDFIPNFPSLWALASYSMGLIGLFISFLIPFNYMEFRKAQKMRLLAGMTGLCVFAIIIKLENLTELDYSVFGAGGMFAAMVVGVIVAQIMYLFRNFSFFKKDSSMPDFVRYWFDSMLPVIILIVAMWLIVYQLNFDVFRFLQSVFVPVTKFAETFGGFVFIYFIMCFTYSMGISTWLLFAVMQPVFFYGIQENMNAVAAGLPATHITTNEVFYSGWLGFGGTGATLTLTILLLFSKVKSLKSLGAASIFPSVLNINEPVVFGCVAWNPLLMVPMWIHGIVLPVITYIALRLGLAAIPNSVFGMWYCPFPVSTWIVSRSFGGLLLLAVLVALSFIIWLPFLRVYEKQLAKKEAAEQV